MTDFSKIFKSSNWTVVHLWFVCLLMIVAAIIMQQLNINEEASITIIFSSLLLNATGSSIFNATNKGIKKNLLKSFPGFIIHALLCFNLIKRMNPDNGEALMNVYLTILIFYIMITFLSVMFKAVSTLMAMQK